MLRRRQHLGFFGVSPAPAPAHWAHPDVNKKNWTDTQKQSVAARAQAVSQVGPTVHPDLSLFNAPADSRPFILTPNPFVNYPLPNAARVTVLQYVVEKGLMAIINKLAIVHFGGNPPDGSGNVIWRMLINGASVKGLDALTAQVGTWAQPNDTVIYAHESDIVQVTVEVPNGQPAMPGGTTTAARFHGWTYPLIQATQKENTGSVKL